MVFCFRANAEGQRLDVKEERERRRNIVIEEAAKERASRRTENVTNDIEIELEEIHWFTVRNWEPYYYLLI